MSECSLKIYAIVEKLMTLFPNSFSDNQEYEYDYEYEYEYEETPVIVKMCKNRHVIHVAIPLVLHLLIKALIIKPTLLRVTGKR